MNEEEIITVLKDMEANPALSTKPAFRANGDKWPDHTISFVDIHMEYMKMHPKTDPSQYLSNLRLRLRMRP